MNELILVIWLFCGILAYGLTYAYFFRQFPREKRISHAWLIPLGPCGLVAILWVLAKNEKWGMFKYGFKL